MLRLLIDQDLDHVILRGLLLRVPNADVITAHQRQSLRFYDEFADYGDRVLPSGYLERGTGGD